MAAPILPYAHEVFSGERQYPIRLPLIPGCGAIGRVRALGPDATTLAIGDWVFCDPTVRSRDNAQSPDITLQGWSARGEGGMALHAYFHDGPFAQQMRLPLENAIPIGEIEASQAPAWCALNGLLIPYGGWLSVGLQPGETALVSGATGNLGSAAVTVALAMGASCVIAPGRNRAMLDTLKARFGGRVRTLELSGDTDADTRRMQAVAPAPIDCMMDILPPAVSTRTVEAAIKSVRREGRISLMGGVGMLGGDDLRLPYPWIMRNNMTIRGQWMYPADATYRMVGLVKAGLVSLDHYRISTFKLDDINQAVANAAEDSPFEMTVVEPQ